MFTPYLEKESPWINYIYIGMDSAIKLGVEINIKTDDDNTAKKARLLSYPDFHREDL
jgi:hypothetical protein